MHFDHVIIIDIVTPTAHPASRDPTPAIAIRTYIRVQPADNNMEMSRITYESVLARVEELLHRRDCLKQLVANFPE